MDAPVGYRVKACLVIFSCFRVYKLVQLTCCILCGHFGYYVAQGFGMEAKEPHSDRLTARR